MLVLKSVRIWSHLLLVKLTCRVTLKILKTGTQIEMISKKKRNQMLTELSVTGRKLNISTVFITKSYLADISLNCTFFLVYKFVLWKFQENKSFNKSLLSHWHKRSRPYLDLVETYSRATKNTPQKLVFMVKSLQNWDYDNFPHKNAGITKFCSRDHILNMILVTR